MPVGTGKGKTSNANGWALGGTNVLSPGTACWFENRLGTNVVVTFVGSVLTGPVTNNLVAGFNLVGSMLPMTGDLITNSVSSFTNYNLGDGIYVYDPVTGYANGTYLTDTSVGTKRPAYWLQWQLG